MAENLWQLWHEILFVIPTDTVVMVATAAGLFVGVRQWRRDRLSASLLIAALLLLCGVYTFVSPGTTSVMLPASTSLRLPPESRLHLLCAVAVVLVLAAGVADLRARQNARTPTGPRRVEDFDGPELDAGFYAAEALLPAVWQILAAIPEIELPGNRRLRPLSPGNFLQRTDRRTASGATAAVFEIVPWKAVAGQRVRSSALQAASPAADVPTPEPAASPPSAPGHA